MPIPMSPLRDFLSAERANYKGFPAPTRANYKGFPAPTADRRQDPFYQLADVIDANEERLEAERPGDVGGMREPWGLDHARIPDEPDSSIADAYRHRLYLNRIINELGPLVDPPPGDYGSGAGYVMSQEPYGLGVITDPLPWKRGIDRAFADRHGPFTGHRDARSWLADDAARQRYKAAEDFFLDKRPPPGNMILPRKTFSGMQGMGPGF